MENPKRFTGRTVNDLVEAYLDLLDQYRKGQIRHNDLVDFLNTELKHE